MSRDDRGRLTPGEHALWFLQRLSPAGGAYNLAGAVRIADLQTAALRRALLRLVERHPALRTTYPAEGGEPFRRVHDRLEPEVAEEDLGDDRHALARRLEAEAVRPFDPATGPLVRLRIFSPTGAQTGSRPGGERAVLFVFHHLIADFWSLAVMLRELGTLYGEEAGTPPRTPLPAPPAATYAEWADHLGAWEREAAGPGAERRELLRAFWQERLAGPAPVLALPADRSRPPSPSGAGDARSRRLGAAATARLVRLGRERGATLFVTLLAGYQLLLHRLSGDDEVWIGAPTAGRGAARWAGTVGYFVNPVVLRGRLSGAPAFAALVDSAGVEARSALAHRDWPFPLIAEQLQPAHDGSWPPLFRAMLTVHRARPAHPEEAALALLALGEGGGHARLGGLTLETLPLRRRAAQLDFALAAAVVDGELRLTLEVDADLFDGTTAERLLGHLASLLAAAGESPETPADALPLLSAAERQELLVEWNDTAALGADGGAAGEETSLAALFAAQAARSPAATALVCGGERWTYAALASAVESFAGQLEERGVEPETRVALCAGRSPRMVVALLGILAAGGAYVPLDPNHPRERLRALLASSGAALLVTESRLLPLFGEDGGPVVLLGENLLDENLPDENENVPSSASRVRPCHPGPRHLAYVLYTSGSTGQPKGVEIEHGGAVALVRWAARTFGPEERSAVLAATSLGFDLSVFELFLPLATGGAVILVEDALHLPAAEQMQPTLINTVPSAMSELVRLRALPASVRTICLAGERLSAGLAEAVHRFLPGVRLLNLYGPTEATTYSTWAGIAERAEPAERAERPEPSIGRPVDGTRVQILDRGLRLVPAGAAGELCLAGAGLARGYAGRPDLTAERFVPDPSSGGGPGSRLYRTGDRARWRPGGCLEILGRLDHQVKLRGFRIEPGEVEAVLAADPAVREAAVLARGDADRRLVAYVAGVPWLDTASLREHLAARLPAPLVPSVFVVLEHLPLTPNGKVDRRLLAALPLPAAAGAPRVAPRDPVENALAAIWGDVLGRELVGAEDDFFALGGHSLLAARVAARVRDLFTVELPLRDFFEASTLAGLAERLRAARRGGAPPLRHEPAPPGASGALAPLSFAQERLWLAARMAPGSPAYHLAGAARLRGPLRPAALERALGEIVARHETLRTRFPDGADGPAALTAPPGLPRLPCIDLAGLAEETRETEAERVAGELARLPFDLESGPVLRLALVRLGAAEHDLLLAIHHIAADGASIDLFFRELAALYGRPGALPRLSVQMADFARWQRAWLTEETLAPHLVWWEAELGGAPAALDLAADLPRAGGMAGGMAGGVCRRHLVPPAELGDLRRRCGATSFMVMTAAFLSLLGRLTGQADVLLGMPVSERGRRELEPLLGCLINTLVLRGRMADDPSFETMLRRTRAACLDAWSHQDLPFERLVERRREIGELAALLEVHAERAAAVALGESTLTLREVETGAAKLDLALTVEEAGPELRAALRYRRGLFDAATAEHVLAGLEALLAGAAADPAARLGDLPLLGEAGRRQVLEWSEGLPPAPGPPLLAAIAARAAEAPDAPALLAAGRVVRTRGGLLRRTVRLAAELAELGAGPGTVVGLCLDRSPELVEAVLGVLATGAAYLPLDPAYPRAYLEHVLADSAVPLVLTRAALRDDLPATRGRVVVLSGEALRDGDPLLPLPPLPRHSTAVQDAPAYLLYTSGSTGLPKGVAVTRRSLDAYLAWVMAGPLAGIDGLPFATSLSFDASLKQLFGPLLGGFPIRLMDTETAHRPERLLAELRGPGRLALNCVPSVWRAVLDALESVEAGGAVEPRQAVEAIKPVSLVRLLLGGEGFDRELLARTFRLFPGLEVWNLYGPTEATANAAAALLAPGDAVTAGRPVRGARLHVVDSRLAPLPPGIAGELVLGGVGIAPGYWRRPALTAARFVPDPFSAEPGARLYRTGDRARFRVLSGSAAGIEIRGRTDRQLKVRGLRIEPGEIEAALQSTPAIAECSVGIDPRGDRLIAWVVPRRNPGGESAWGAGAAAALRRHLEAGLPAAMVPAAFLVLAALPRTPAGKVDHAALAAALPTHLIAPAETGAADPALPRTPAEEVLTGIWAEVLGVGEVDLHDDFFARGGHSLLAARLLSRVRNAFGVDLPLRSLFAAPTVAGLAAAVAAARRDRRAAVAPAAPVSLVPRAERLLLSFAQERLWFLDQWMPDSPAYNIPAAVRLDGVAGGSLDVRALAAALSEIVRRHEALRGTFSAIAGLPVQILQEPAATPLPVVDLAGLDPAAAEAAAAALAGEEARRPFDLRRGPLLRLCLLRLGDGRHTLLLNLHHIVADGWSMAVLINELHVLYPAFRTHPEGPWPPPLPPLPVQYPDFAAWQRRRAESGAFAGDLAWWHGFLAGAPAGIDLPTDRPRPAWSIHRGALAPFALGPALTAPLRALARRCGATLFMTLLAAFQALLARLAGAEDLVVGTAVDQRTPEVEGLIGLFVNLLALRGDLSGDPAFTELLGRARRATLDAHDHRELPFERLVAEVEPVRHPGRNPLFQVAFSLQSAPLPEPDLPGLSLAVRELDTGTARFDLTLLLRETAGGVSGSLEHSTDLFDAATVGRLLAGLAALLGEIVADPALPLSRLPLLAPAERRQILAEWGRSRDRRPRRDGLGELFARQAERTPGAVAVSAGGVETTYGELARRAAFLARRLRALGAGPDTPVALCLERSLEMVVGIVAIIQAGGAYVPLDLGYPRERLAWMLADSGARIALARGAGLALPGESLGLQVVDLDQLPAGREEAAGGSPAVFPCDLDNLAYIVYTSGSTGRPKGVAATHRGVVRLVVDPGYADLGPRETLLQLAPLPFDASTFEIWGALANGGRLVIHPPGPVALRELGETLRRERITTLFLTTGLFHQMVDEELASLAGLRQLLTGGDVISVARVRRVLAALPALRLIHAYGPTEATTFATCRTVTAADAARPALTLGRPVARTSVHILDRGLEPVPPGVPGELWLGGDGLARGYRGRPEMTALRFVPSLFPEGEAGGERLYRTGDLARWLSDGTVDFLGRIDRQVKIRGFRVEPAEVEAVLESHPWIAACVVLPRGEAEDKRLVAWVVSDLSEAELLAWCRERLPPFLIPAAFVPIAAVPLDLNGKVDRRALPEPDRSRRANAYVAPRTPVEERVAAVWAEVLRLDRVGADDDFFLLGGHSLLATQIVSRLSRDFAVDLGLRAFFEEPTVTGVAVAITREQMRQGDPERMAGLLARVQSLSPEELADLLRESGE